MTTHVQLGDTVTFQHVDGLLCAASDQTLCEVAHSPSSRSATLFRVAPMQDYASSIGSKANNAQDKSIANNNANINNNNNNNVNANKESDKKSSASNSIASATAAALAAATSHRAFVYGQIVQLIHVQSGKFLHGGATATASATQGGAYALLDANGDARCYWKLGIPLAMRGVRRVGDRVQSGDEVHLEHAVSGMFMHASPFVTTDDGELRALLASAPDSTFVVRRAGRPTQLRRIAARDAMRVVRRDGRFLVACTKSRTAWFLRVLDDNESPDAAAAIWILERAPDSATEYMARLFGTRLYLALPPEHGHSDTPLTLSDKPGEPATRFITTAESSISCVRRQASRRSNRQHSHNIDW
jgi:hypothetical protein